MIVIAAITAALATFLGVYTLATPGRPREVTSRLGRFERSDATDREARLAEPFSTRIAAALGGRILAALGKLLPASIVASMESRLVRAGEPISLHAFLACQVVAVCAAVVIFLFALASGFGAVGTLAVLALAGFVGTLPLLWLRARVNARKSAILKALPDAVDLIVTTVEAGLSIDAALSEVGHETQGPLGAELRLTVRETTLGRSRRDALQRLIDRTNVPELKTFVQSIIQAEQTGVPIGQVLRAQAAQMRVRKRQWAEGEAQRAPVKMVVILVFLMLPALLITVMGPAVIRLQESDF